MCVCVCVLNNLSELNLNEKDNLYLIQNIILRKNCANLLMQSLCLKDFIVKMIVITKNTFLNLPFEFLQRATSHYLWYCFDFMSNKISQFCQSSTVYI